MSKEKEPIEDENELPPSQTGLPTFVEDSPLLRLFVFDRRFRLALVLGLFGAVALALCIPRVWVKTPPGFTPVIKVSGLDTITAWSLRRSAQKAAKQGHSTDAIAAWKLCLGRDSSNLEVNRELLSYLRSQDPVPWDYQPLAIRQSLWLLKLGGTNLADAELVSGVFNRYELDELTVSLLGSQREHLTTEGARLLAAAAMTRGNMEFVQRVVAGRPAEEKDPELMLYHAAWQAAWGPPRLRAEGRRQLDAAKHDPKLQLLAYRLHLTVSYTLSQLSAFEECFKELQKQGKDTLTDHSRYWQMLSRGGRRTEAVSLAKNYTVEPRTVTDCLVMSRALASIGQEPDAISLLDRYRPQFSGSLELWRMQAELLVQQERWDELRGLSLAMSNIKELRKDLSGYIKYLDGLGHLHRNRRDLAEECFREIPSLSLTHPFLGYQVATSLMKLGELETARTLLERLEASFGNSFEYWFQVEVAAYEAKDIEAMLVAGEKAYALAPNHGAIVNNYAAALLILRQRPAEAVRLTLRRLTEAPNDVGAQLNHSLALLQNMRNSEAQVLLKRIDVENLDGLFRTVFYLAWFEAHLQLGQFDEARKAYHNVEARFLAPPQQRWCEGEFKKLETSKSG